MDRAVLYMKLYTFGMPFMNCTIAEIILDINNIKKFSDKPEEEHLSGNFLFKFHLVKNK